MPSPKTMSASSSFKPTCHLPIPGQKLSGSSVLGAITSPFLCDKSTQPNVALFVDCTGIILHHRSVPGSSPSASSPLGSGGCTRETSTPIYLAHDNENGIDGAYCIGWKVAWNRGLWLDVSTRWSVVSCGKTLTRVEPSAKSSHSKRARCFGIFQSKHLAAISSVLWGYQSLTATSVPAGVFLRDVDSSDSGILLHFPPATFLDGVLERPGWYNELIVWPHRTFGIADELELA